MPDEANIRDTKNANPMDLWKQWYDSSTKMWSNLLEGRKESIIDPYGLYRSWLKGIGEATDQGKEPSPPLPFPGLDIQELWKQWFDTTTQVWRKATEKGMDPLGLTSQWLKLMEESRARLTTRDTPPTDPFTFFKQWYDATSESWSRVVGETFGNEKFVEATRQFLESYTSFYSTLRHNSEEYLRNLQFATRSDMTRVAGLVVALEEKVDHVEEALGDFADGSFHIATDESVRKLIDDLSRVENSISALPTSSDTEALTQRLAMVEGAIGALPTSSDTEALAKRLDKIEASLRELPGKIDIQLVTERLDSVESRLEQLSVAYAKAESVNALTRRLDGVEHKLDRVLAALEKLNTHTEPAEAGEHARTRARRNAKSAAGVAEGADQTES